MLSLTWLRRLKKKLMITYATGYIMASAIANATQQSAVNRLRFTPIDTSLLFLRGTK